MRRIPELPEDLTESRWHIEIFSPLTLSRNTSLRAGGNVLSPARIAPTALGSVDIQAALSVESLAETGNEESGESRSTIDQTVSDGAISSKQSSSRSQLSGNRLHAYRVLLDVHNESYTAIAPKRERDRDFSRMRREEAEGKTLLENATSSRF